jgi:hypothetical protein
MGDERDGITVTATTSRVHVAHTPRNVEVTLGWDESLRPYTPETFGRLIDTHSGFTIIGCYKEIGKGDDDISRFARALDPNLPSAGRAIVVLKRT